jgi:hypothetical protein
VSPQRVPLGALDDWLYEAKPQADCPRCASEKVKLDDAAKSGDANARFEAARNIRQCKHGARG